MRPGAVTAELLDESTFTAEAESALKALAQNDVSVAESDVDASPNVYPPKVRVREHVRRAQCVVTPASQPDNPNGHIQPVAKMIEVATVVPFAHPLK